MRCLLFAILWLCGSWLYAQSADTLRTDSLVHQLPDVYVSGERPLARVQGSTIVYDLPRILAQKGANHLYDAVKELPGVVEEGGRLLLGGLSTTLMLDGKATTLSASEVETLLRSLPADQVERIEVMYTAPAYMQVRGAVINIIRKRKADQAGRLQGEVQLLCEADRRAMLSERVTFLYQKGHWAIDGMYKYNHGKSYHTITEESHHKLVDGSLHSLLSKQRNFSRKQGHEYFLNIDHRWAEKHLLSLYYYGSRHHAKVRQDLSGHVQGGADIDSHTWLHNLRLDYESPVGLKLGAEMTYYESPEGQQLKGVLPTGLLEYGVQSKHRVNRWKGFWKQEHALPQGWKLNYGGFYIKSLSRSNQAYEEVKSSHTALPQPAYSRVGEDVVNLYIGTGKHFGAKWMLEASLAAEYFHNPHWNRWDWYPTLNLTYLPRSGHMWMLGFSSETIYPPYAEQNNFVTYSHGGYNEIWGNPQLRPSSAYQLQLVYLLNSKYQFVLWGKHHPRYITQTPYQQPGRLAIRYQYQNLDFQQEAGLQAVIPFKAASWYQARLTLMGIWHRNKARHFYDIPFDRSVLFAMAHLNQILTWATLPSLSLSVDAHSRTKAIQAIYDLPPAGFLNISGRWTFAKKRGMVRLYVNDLFETQATHPRIDYQGQHLMMRFSSFREWGASLTYRFGGYKEKAAKTVDKTRF